MKPGLRLKLFLFTLALIFTTDVAVGIYLEVALRGWVTGEIENELVRHARSAAETAQLVEEPDSIAAMDRLADRLGQEIEKRVTFIASDGRVLGDSSLEPEEVVRVENHGNRPEVLDAKLKGAGFARRFSSTVRADMLYAAVPFAGRHGLGVARVEVSLARVEDIAWELRLIFLAAGGLGLVVAMLIAGAGAHLLTRALRELLHHARRLSRGVLPVPSTSDGDKDEIAGLADSFQRLTDELDAVMESLALERQRLATVLEEMSEPVIALDRERRITLANRGLQRLLHLVESPVGLSIDVLFPDGEVSELTSRCLLEEGTHTLQFDLPGGDGRRMAAAISCRQRSHGCVMVLHDITEFHRWEEMRRRFVADASHELRNPVCVILANSELLMDGMEPASDERRLMEAVQRNATRMSRIITDLLDLSRLDAGAPELHLEPLDAMEKVERAFTFVENAARDKNIRLIAEGNAPPLLADRDAFFRILINLLENAIKYTPAGGRVTARCHVEGEMVLLEVEDNGPGVEPQHRERLFVRFYRVDRGRSREMGGSGLGLAIVKGLAESMGGRVGMRPADPRGSIFWVALPAAPEGMEPPDEA
ncbi:MAG: PAS domain-containing protein [Magnetococcales bacterium]|nr:PAS domain-containing protein [Magnetococcales bacterium]